MVVEATEPEPSGSIANPAASTSPSLSHRFLDSKFYLLVVVGEIVTEEHLRRAIGNIELGKWPRAPRDARWQTRKHDPTQGATVTALLPRAPHPTGSAGRQRNTPYARLLAGLRAGRRARETPPGPRLGAGDEDPVTASSPCPRPATRATTTPCTS